MKIKVAVVLLILALFFSSCSSIYDHISNHSENTSDGVIVHIDEDSEYFTPGTLQRSGNSQYGYLYRDYWIYKETQIYKELADVSPSGNKVYSQKIARRLVKVNIGTGEVSSLCIVPNCNHSPRSGCDMIADDVSGAQIYVSNVIGDWLVIKKSAIDKVYGSKIQTFAYNPMTGEKKDILINEYGETTVTKWQGAVGFGNRMYCVKVFMDYSNTDYVPGSGKPLAEYEPETVSVCHYYDFDKQETVELFELPDGYLVTSVSNKRIFLIDPEGVIFSCDYEGNNMVREDVFNFSADNRLGTYAYCSEFNGFKRYDIQTNTIKQITLPFKSVQYPAFTKSGIVYETYTTIDEHEKMLKGIGAFADEHPEMMPDEVRLAYDEICQAVEYSGTAQIWKSDFNGEDLKLIFEKENAVLNIICGNDKYLFGFATYGDPNNNFKELPVINEGRSMINLETGEITPIPLLELIPPPDDLVLAQKNK